jgi:nucleotide-binding universal stress UspA family protein
VFAHAGAPPPANGNATGAAPGAAPAALAAAGIAGDELRVVTGEPVAALRAEIAATAPALVLVGSPATSDGMLGGVCRGLLRDDGPPVAIIPPGAAPPRPERPIACAVSLGEHDEAAVRFADAFAAASGRRLLLRGVLGAQDVARMAAARARSSVAAPTAPEAPPTARADVLAKRLLDVASETQADALVVAAGPTDPVAHALERGTLWHAAACAVIVVRP